MAPSEPTPSSGTEKQYLRPLCGKSCPPRSSGKCNATRVEKLYFCWKKVSARLTEENCAAPKSVGLQGSPLSETLDVRDRASFRACFMFEFMTFVTTTTVSIETRDRFLSASPAALRLSSSVSGLPPVRSWSKRPEAMPEGPALSERNPYPNAIPKTKITATRK